jgi:hypothetical protein
MASLVYNVLKAGNMAADIDLDGDDIRAILVMANTTAGADPDKATITAITTLDEADPTSGYARITCTGETVTQDDANDRAEFTTDNLSYAGLSGDATRNYAGVLFYKHVTDDDDSIPLFYAEFASPAALGATQVDIACPAEGWLQLA